jgi:hypothetical protein
MMQNYSAQQQSQMSPLCMTNVIDLANDCQALAYKNSQKVGRQ